MIPNNSFTQDTIDVRAERLQLIELNLATHVSSLLELDSGVATRLATCYTDFNAKKVLAAIEDAESKGATTSVRLAFDFLRKEYIIVKKFADNLYKDLPDFLDEYKLNVSYPNGQLEQLERAEVVLGEHTRLVGLSLTPLIPETLITRLTTALTAAKLSRKNKAKEKGEATHAHNVFDAEWDSETDDLKDLYQSSVVTWNDDHINLVDFGFVRSSLMGHGGGGPVPAAPSGLNLTNDDTLSWTAVSNATSYSISLSYDGGTHWESDFNSSTNSSVVPVAEVGKLYYRVRARNANGYGEYSGTFEHLFGLSAVDNFAYADDQFTWNPVEFANGYDIQYSAVNEENWVLIFNGNATSFSHTPASGSWTYRIRASYGSIKSEWVEIEVEQV